jgi:hypothetical protein
MLLFDLSNVGCHAMIVEHIPNPTGEIPAPRVVAQTCGRHAFEQEYKLLQRTGGRPNRSSVIRKYEFPSRFELKIEVLRLMPNMLRQSRKELEPPQLSLSLVTPGQENSFAVG